MNFLDPRLPDRFWAKAIPEPNTGCWLWTGAIRKATDGYGAFWVGGRHRPSHRVSYEVLVGPVAADKQLDHLCRERSCVNPDHLEPVTPRENTLRGATPAAANASKTHCASGHPFDASNTHVSASGQRVCRACGRERAMRGYSTESRRARYRKGGC